MLPTELLYLVFRALDAKSLTSAACVCSAWSETAIHTKWSTKKVTLRTLLNVYVPMKKPSKKTLYLSPKDDTPGTSDKRWNRMLELARMARRLVMDHPIKAAFRKHLEDRLRKSGMKNLCVELQTFSADDLANIISTCQLLLGPSLRCLKLSALESPDTKLAALTAIAAICPQIESLSLDTDDSYHSDIITSMTNLRTLNVQGYFSFDTWRRLAEIEHRLAHVTFKSVLFDLYVNAPSHRLSMPYVQSLNFEKAEAPEVAIAILRSTWMAGLLKTALNFDELSNEECVDIMQNLKQCAPCLEDLSVRLGDDFEEQRTKLPYTLFADFKHLRHLRMMFIDVDILDKESLTAFATQLPNLESFQWEPSLADLDAPQGLPADLVEVLAQSWRSLRTLDLSVDASGFDPTSPPSHDAKFTSVKDFSFSLSGFANHMKPIAQWISDIFPGGQANSITMQRCTLDKKGRVRCIDEDIGGEQNDNWKLRAMIQAYQTEGPNADELADILYKKEKEEYERRWATGFFDELILRLEEEAD